MSDNNDRKDDKFAENIGALLILGLLALMARNVWLIICME